MSFKKDIELVEALSALSPMAETILGSRPMDFTNDTYEGFQQLLDQPMRQVLGIYSGRNFFLVDVRRSNPWTLPQSRAVANILLRQIRDSAGRSTEAPTPPSSFPAYTPPENRREVKVIEEYEPKIKVDLRSFPSGRFALHFGGEWRFFIVTELKRRSTLRGKFRWTKNRYAYETLEKGDRTVREQSGDTKKFIGKQRMNQPYYYGEADSEELLERIAWDPASAMVNYGKQLGKCAYCGRSLTDPESRQRGIGPDCWEHKHEPRVRAGFVQTVHNASVNA